MKTFIIAIITILYCLAAAAQIPDDKSLVPRTAIENIYFSLPQGYTNYYTPDFHQYGFGWAHYSLKTPLAWMKTKEQFFSAGCKRQSAHKNCISGNIRNVFSLL